MEKLAKAAIVLAFWTFAPPANSAVLTGFLQSETDLLGDVIWSIGVTDKGPVAAMNAKIGSATLTQTSGAACTPVVSLPGSLGTIASGATAFASVTIDFAGCAFAPNSGFPLPSAPFFTLDATFSADNGLTGSLHLTDLLPYDDGTVFPTAATSVPEPPAWALMLLGFGFLGAGSAARRWLMLPPAARG
jgi:hypothetical protein